jgi:hypothetical protein
MFGQQTVFGLRCPEQPARGAFRSSGSQNNAGRTTTLRKENEMAELNEQDLKWLKDAGYGDYVPGEHRKWMDAAGGKVSIDAFAIIVGAIAEKLTYKSLKAGAVGAELQQLERMWKLRFTKGTPFHEIGSHIGGTVSRWAKEAGFQPREQLNSWINTKAEAIKQDVQARIKNAR